MPPARRSQTPDYVRRGSCGDCLVVWGRREQELLDRIDKLERALRDITACDYRGNEPPEQAIARRALVR